MSPLALRTEEWIAQPQAPPSAASSLRIESLASEHKAEVLTFLAERPLHTVFLASFARDNGLVSPLNRGVFYACRNAEGQLEGVALIGHATLIEARSEAALEMFAHLAQQSPAAHVIMGERDKVESFWNYYTSTDEQAPRVICRDMLLEQRWPIEVLEAVQGLRLATMDDLNTIMPVHAQMAFKESGVNPMETDPTGFRLRCARRIEQGRVWVWTDEAGRLIFKADIISETPETIYLEGIHVHPEERGKGYAQRCLSQLSRTLLQRAQAICLLVNEQNQEGMKLYQKVGYKLSSHYDTIFLHRKD